MLAATGAAILLLATVPAGGQESNNRAQDEPDDRLPRDDQRLVHELVERGMPELVEALLARRRPADRVFIARAYAKAGAGATDPTLRERFFQSAADAYRRVIALETDPQWLRGQRRRLRIAQWRVELADMILRRWIAPDLDRFEITSGLDFNRRRLTDRLREAHATYLEAGRRLDDLLIGLRTDEERYLLLGIAGQITSLHERCRLNTAWAAAYIGLVGGRDLHDRQGLLDAALNLFDGIARRTTKTSIKYNALLGAGIALREAARYGEADAAFDRVRTSTAPLSLTARARFEMARSRLLAGRYGAARRELDGLAATRTDQLAGEDAGAAFSFYVRLAPVLRAYSYILEAASGRHAAAGKNDLRARAVAELTAIAKQGGPWPEIAQVYLEALASDGGRTRLTSAELRLKAGRLMGEKKYGRAAEILGELIERSDSKDERAEARFNLGVCRFQTRDLRAAAASFLEVARTETSADLAQRGAYYSYRCWRRLADDSSNAEDYRRLAEAARILVDRFPDHASAAEARWVAALALQEAGDYRGALLAYAQVGAASEHHWQARRNAARCKQSLYETLPATASLARRRRAGRDAVAAWLDLADRLTSSEASGQRSGTAPFQDPATLDDWIAEARLAAATLLADDGLRAFKESLTLLGGLPPSGRALGLKIRCFRGLGELEKANAALGEFLEQAGSNEIGSVLLGLAAGMEEEISRLRAAGRHREATRMAADTVETVRRLLSWIESQPAHSQHAAVVRFSLANALIQAGRHAEAMTHLEQLMSEHPNNGSYVRAAALLHEQAALSGAPDQTQAAQDKAESLWARLLEDPTLLDRAPAEYWEARYHWLEHQFRHGRAAEVYQGIEAEKAWYPALGGPPWQGRLLDLAARAGSQAGSNPP